MTLYFEDPGNPVEMTFRKISTCFVAYMMLKFCIMGTILKVKMNLALIKDINLVAIAYFRCILESYNIKKKGLLQILSWSFTFTKPKGYC